MIKFDLAGFYKYDRLTSGQGDLTGEITLDERDGFFEGNIIDHASVSPNQILKGYISQQDGLRKMLFLKFPNRSFLANLGDQLSSPISGDSFEGKYEGSWRALNFKIEFDRDIGLFRASFDRSLSGLGDAAELNLRAK